MSFSNSNAHNGGGAAADQCCLCAHESQGAAQQRDAIQCSGAAAGSGPAEAANQAAAEQLKELFWVLHALRAA